MNFYGNRLVLESIMTKFINSNMAKYPKFSLPENKYKHQAMIAKQRNKCY